VNVETSDLPTDVTERDPQPSELRSGISPVRILVVDDEPEIAESLSEFLSRKEGYTVAVASDGLQAMQQLEESLTKPSLAIDIVLLDVRMPLMSGPELLEWLRNHSELKYTRVIMLTAAAGYEEKVEALTAGADDYITKPYYPLELLARVKTILRTQQLEKQLHRQSQQLRMLNQVSQAVSARLASREVLALAVKGVEAIIEVELAAVFMVDDKRELLRCREINSTGEYVAANSYRSIPIGVGIIGRAFDEGHTLCLNTPLVDPDFHSELDAPAGFPVRSLIATPLFVRSKPVGVLYVLNSRHGAFTENDRGLLTSLASSVGRAVEISWLFQRIRQRQHELLESRNQLQAVIDSIAHPIYTIDNDWKLVAVNEARSRKLEISPDLLTGRLCYQVFFDRSTRCEHCNAFKTISERVEQRWTVKWIAPDHRPEEFDVNAYPIPGATSGSPTVVVVWQDRTEERRLENSLMQAGKLAAIGQLAAGVAHEINNPLTAINANAQMLQMSIPPDHDDYESVELIARAGERAAQVVRGLLDFAREKQYAFESADINASISQALNLVSYQLTATNIEIVTHLAQDLPAIEASLEHLQSVWLNLLLNARDALQEITGQKVVTISTEFDTSGNQIRVAVHDTGRGMSSAETIHIFEPFYTTKAPGKGTGLGLATSHRIVEQHGGQINVTSTPGKGTLFTVQIPISDRGNQNSSSTNQ